MEIRVMRFLRLIAIMFFFLTSLHTELAECKPIELLFIPEEVRHVLVSLANELPNEEMDCSLAQAAQLLAEGNTCLPDDLAQDAFLESLALIDASQDGTFRRPSNKTFSNVAVKNLLTTRKLRVCDSAIINGTLTVNGCVVDPCKEPPIVGGTCAQYYVNQEASSGSSEFKTIQAAIDQAVADGFGGENPAQVNICPGSYTEDIILPDGINLRALMPPNSVVLNGYIQIPTSGASFATTIDSLVINMNSTNSAITVTGNGSNLILLKELILNSPSAKAIKKIPSKHAYPKAKGKKAFANTSLIRMNAPNSQIFTVGRNSNFTHLDNGSLVNIESGGIIMTGGFVTARMAGTFTGNSASVFSNMSMFLGGSGDRNLFTVNGASVEIYNSYIGNQTATNDNIFKFTGEPGSIIAESNTLDVFGDGVVALSDAPGSYFGLGTTTYPNEFAITRIDETNLGTLFNTDKIVAASVDTTRTRATNFLISNNTDVVSVTTNGGDLLLPEATKNRGVKIVTKNKTNTDLTVQAASGDTINGLASFILTPECNTTIFASDGTNDWIALDTCSSGSSSSSQTNSISPLTPDTCIEIIPNPVIPDVTEIYISSGPVLAKYNVVTQDLTIIGNMPAGAMFDIAFTPDGTLYGVGMFGSTLYVIDKDTADTTLVGPVLPNLNPNSLTSDSNGILYGSTFGQLYTIDKNTAALTVVGTIGGSPFSNGDLVFIGDNLYFATTANSLYNININDLPSSYNIGSFLPDPGPVFGLAELYFDCKVHLYGAADMNVFEIDPDTGRVFNLVTLPTFGLGFLQGATSLSWVTTPDLMCFCGNLNMQFNDIESVTSLQVDNLYTTSQFPTGAINVHNDLNIFNSPPGGGHITFTAGTQIGNSSTTAAGSNAVAVGNSASAAATDAIAIGDLASVAAASTRGIAVGLSAASSVGVDTTAVGANAVASNTNASAFGKSATASGTASVALGKSATANVANGIAIGNGATTNGVAGTVCVGTNAGTVNLDASHPLALALNASGVNAGAAIPSTHSLGIVINGVQYRILLANP